MRILAAILLAGCPALLAQSPLALPGCEALPEVRQTLDDKLGSKVTENMKGADQNAARAPRAQRSDRQVSTWDGTALPDANLGLVLPAYSFVLSLLDGFAIPQNWILDPKGAWRWSQMGFDASDAQWAGTVVAKLQSP